MSSRLFYTVFFILHLVVLGGAFVMWTHYGLFAALFVVIGSVIALQTWLAERRKANRRRSVGR